MATEAPSAAGTRHRLETAQGGPADHRFRIALAPIPLDGWFEPGEASPAVRKGAIFAAHPTLSWGDTDGSRPAQAEIAGMIRDWLSHRGRRSDLDPDAPPLRAAADLVSDDLCLMQRTPAGEWRLGAASLCAPSFFSVEDVLDRPLSAIHAPVPGFNTDFLPRVTRIFDHLRPDTVLERRNWSLVPTTTLFIPSADKLRAELPHLDAETIAGRLHVRRERQTIRKAPETGAVLFTIRIWLEPFADLMADPDRRAAFAVAWARLKTPEGAMMAGYKHLGLFDAAVRVGRAGG